RSEGKSYQLSTQSSPQKTRNSLQTSGPARLLLIVLRLEKVFGSSGTLYRLESEDRRNSKRRPGLCSIKNGCSSIKTESASDVPSSSAKQPEGNLIDGSSAKNFEYSSGGSITKNGDFHKGAL